VHVPGGRRTAAELIAAAKERNAALLVVGTASTSERTGVRLGGVALQLVHHADISLVLVPS
jgi:nucleotide-binding universal stress UspA family protein